jgi:glycine betaine/proline transport system substrate-binding protein
MKRFFLTTLLVLGLLGTAAAQNKETITLGYVLWDSEIASTHVLAVVIEDELGYPVEMISLDVGPLFTGVARGDLDATVSAWLPATHEAYWDEFGGGLVDLGPNLEGADIGLVVPAYVEVDSIADLNEHVAEFDGRIIGIDPGAGIMAATEEAIEEYGLDYTLVDGSDAAMAAALDRAISREEPVIVTGWRPHWMWAAYDVKYLDDPLDVFGASESIHTIVNPEFAENGPADVLAFLDNFHWTGEQMGAVMLSIQNDNLDPFDAARKWVEENPEVVQGWLQ